MSGKGCNYAARDNHEHYIATPVNAFAKYFVITMMMLRKHFILERT